MNSSKNTAQYRVKPLLLIGLCLLSCILASCSLLRTHKLSVEQGNIIKPAQVDQLRLGMSEAAVQSIMGTPLLSNIFTPGRVDYLYTFQKPYHPRQQTRVTCQFHDGRLIAIRHSG